MKRIDRQAKLNAATLMLHDDGVSSVRVVVEKETNRMWIEFTEFPKKTVDKLLKL